MTGPFEKQQEKRARLVCQATRDLRSPPATSSGDAGVSARPRGDQAAASCTHLQQVFWEAAFWESAGLGGWAAGRRTRAPRPPPGMEAARPTPAGRRGRELGARGALPRAALPPLRPPQLRSAPGKRSHPAPPRGPSALEDRPGPRVALHPHLVEAVLAVGFRFHLHLHQHRVRPRHIAQHGWGRRCSYRRLFFGVRGAAASPPIRPTSGLGEAGPREAAGRQTPALRPTAAAPSRDPRASPPARSPAPESPRRRRTPAARLPAPRQGLL